MEYIEKLKKLGFSVNPSARGEKGEMLSGSLLYRGKAVGIYDAGKIPSLEFENRLAEMDNAYLSVFIEAYQLLRKSGIKIASLKNSSVKKLEEQVAEREGLAVRISSLERHQ